MEYCIGHAHSKCFLGRVTQIVANICHAYFSRLVERLVVRKYIIPALPLDLISDKFGSITAALVLLTHTVTQKLDLVPMSDVYHRLRGSASPVLTRRLDLSMGKGNFRHPTASTPSTTDHQNICHRSLRQRPLWLCQIRCISVHGGLLGTWVKYNQNYFYL